jgi:hypothetical protein
VRPLSLILLVLLSTSIYAKSYKTAYDFAYCYEIADWVISWRNTCVQDSDCKPADKIESQGVIDRMKKLEGAVATTVASRGITPDAFETAKTEKKLWIQNEVRSTTSFDMPAFKEWINTTVEVCTRDFYVP